MRLSSIEMYADVGGNVLLQGDLIFDHALIIKGVRLIEGTHGWYIQFPRNGAGERFVHLISKSYYQHLLEQLSEYYHQATLINESTTNANDERNN